MFINLNDPDNDDVLAELRTNTPGLRLLEVGHKLNFIMQFQILLLTLISAILLVSLMVNGYNVDVVTALVMMAFVDLATLVTRIIFDIVIKQVNRKEEEEFIRKLFESNEKGDNNDKV